MAKKQTKIKSINLQYIHSMRESIELNPLVIEAIDELLKENFRNINIQIKEQDIEKYLVLNYNWIAFTLNEVLCELIIDYYKKERQIEFKQEIQFAYDYRLMLTTIIPMKNLI